MNGGRGKGLRGVGEGASLLPPLWEVGGLGWGLGPRFWRALWDSGCPCALRFPSGRTDSLAPRICNGVRARGPFDWLRVSGMGSRVTGVGGVRWGASGVGASGGGRPVWGRPVGGVRCGGVRWGASGVGASGGGRPVWGRPVWGASGVGASGVGGVRWGGVRCGGRPVGGRPVGGRPVGGRPVGGRPVWGRPVWGRPVWGASGGGASVRPEGNRRMNGGTGWRRAGPFESLRVRGGERGPSRASG